MPTAKVDARSFKYAKLSDAFLRPVAVNQVSSPSCDSPDSAVVDPGQLIWRELAGNQDAVTSYIICLIAKLISLDSGQGNRALPDVYKDITEMQVDISQYKNWSSKEKSLPNSTKPAALCLQHSIIATIHFLKQFYGFTPSVQLRNMFFRWNIARNPTTDRNEVSDPFEVEVLTSFSVAASKDVIIDPKISSFCTEVDQRLVKELINDCYLHHRRAFFGSLPPDACKLTKYVAVAKSLSYIRLRDLVSRNPNLLRFAVNHVCTLLKTGISHTQDYGEREVLLPLLHLLKEFLTMMVDVDHHSIYQSLMPFYSWPASHSESVKEVLHMLQLEKKVKGTLYRRTLLKEHQLGLKLKQYKPKNEPVIMLVDTSIPGSGGHRLYQSFLYHQEKPPSTLIKKLMLCSIFQSSPENEIPDMKKNVMRLSEEHLTQYCEEGLDITEEAVSMETADEAEQYLAVEIKSLYAKLLITLEAYDDDSTVTYNDTGDTPISFFLPPPYVPVYELEQTFEISMMEKLKEVILRAQSMDIAPSSRVDSLLMSYPPVTSHSSLNSTDSSFTDQFEGGDFNQSRNSDLSAISEQWNERGGSNGSKSSLSPTAKIRPDGTKDVPLSPGDVKEKPLTQVTSNNSTVESNGFGELPSQDSDKDTSDTSSSRTSEEAGSRHSTDSSSNTPKPRPGSGYERRYTDVSSSARRKLLQRVSWNQTVTPTTSIGSVTGGSIHGVTQRGNPTAYNTLRIGRSQSLSASFKPRQRSSKIKKVHIILAGNDTLLCNTAKAFTHLRIREPNLFCNMDIGFHYIPLSKASSGWVKVHEGGGASSLGDLPDPGNELCKEETGKDVLVGQYLSHVDSWYEQNVMLSVHNCLQLLPDDSRFSGRPFSISEEMDARFIPPLTPARTLVNVTSNFLREATRSIHVKMFKVKMTLRSEKSIKGFEHREMFMFHRLDIQKISGKKANRQAKQFEAGVALTELSLDSSFVRSDMIQLKDVWIIRASNIPHPDDLGVSNPESECFELSIIKVLAEGGRLSATKYRVAEETQHHVYELVVEAKDKQPLSVIIDEDLSCITESVVRVEVAPAYIDQAVVGSTLRRTERQERQMNFPLMTFWPVDL